MENKKLNITHADTVTRSIPCLKTTVLSLENIPGIQFQLEFPQYMLTGKKTIKLPKANGKIDWHLVPNWLKEAKCPHVWFEQYTPMEGNTVTVAHLNFDTYATLIEKNEECEENIPVTLFASYNGACFDSLVKHCTVDLGRFGYETSEMSFSWEEINRSLVVKCQHSGNINYQYFRFIIGKNSRIYKKSPRMQYIDD